MSRALRLERSVASTAQLASVYPWHFDGALTTPGPLLGFDLISGGAPFTFDPFEAVDRGLAGNPNVMVVGEPGYGKSAVAKTIAYWLGGAFGWRVVAIDVKGEYPALADALGLQRIELHPGGTTRINPLASDGTDEADRDRLRFVGALTSVLVGRGLRPVELTAVEEAVTLAASGARARKGEPLLGDVVRLLSDPPVDLLAVMQKDAASFLDDTDEVRYALRRLVTGSLAGMFDSPTNVAIDHHRRGVVLDLSRTGDDDELLQLVMLAGTRAVTQLDRGAESSHGSSAPSTRTLMLNDETWRLGTTPQTVRWLQHLWKLGRQRGVANFAMIHRFSDLGAQANDGTALAKIGKALVNDSATTILFRHKHDDAVAACELLGLPTSVVEVLTHLPRGRSVIHCGGHLATAEVRMTARLAEVCETDRQHSST